MRKILLVTFLIIFNMCLCVIELKAINMSFSEDLYRDSETSKLRKMHVLSLSFSKDLTERMRWGGSLNYSKTDYLNNNRESITPMFYYNLVNDLFSLMLNYNYNLNNFEEKDLKLHSWNLNSNLRTSYKKIDILFLANISKRWSEGLAQEIENKNIGYGFSLKRKFEYKFLKGLNINFDFRKNKNEDERNDSTIENTFNVVKITYFKHFRKVNLGLNGEISQSKTEVNYKGTTYKWEYTLPLINGTFSQPITTNSTFIFKIDDQWTIEEINFFIDYETEETAGSAIIWDIYKSVDNVNWERVAQNVVLPYTFKSPIKYPYVYIKLEVKWISSQGVDLVNPKFVGYKYINTGGKYEQQIKFYKSGMNLGVVLPFKSRLNSFIGIEKYKYEINDYEKTRYYANINLGCSKIKYFIPNFSFRYAIDKYQERKEDKQISYTLNVASLLKKTIKLNGGISYSKNWYNGTPVIYNFSLFTGENFELYPDLILNLSQGYSQNKNLLSGYKTTAYTFQINILARIKPNLTGELRNYLGKNKDNTNKESFYTRHEVSISWRISDLCTFNTFYSITFSENKPTYTYNNNLFIALTKRLKFNIGFNGLKEESNKSYNTNFNIYWLVTRKITLNSNFNYSKVENVFESGSKWSVGVRLRYVF